MDMYSKYISPLGYKLEADGIDSYGVDHSGFSIQDELEYQNARMNREKQMMQKYNALGITTNYPQCTTDFWGCSDNNCGFGMSNISGNIATVSDRLKNSGVISPEAQQNAWKQHKQRTTEADLLMDGMDMMYGMNRTINGMSFGGLDWLGDKFGFDSRMNEYLNLKNEQDRKLTQMAGTAAEFGGAALSGRAIANAGYNQANMLYNGYKIGKNYDKLRENPYLGNGTDIIARMKNHNGEPVVLQRGEAIPGANGEVIVHGKALERETGTLRNYGLNKGIYRHGISRADAQRIPRAIQQNPVETNQRGQYCYIIPSKNGDFKVITSPTNNGTTIASTYYPIK